MIVKKKYVGVKCIRNIEEKAMTVRLERSASHKNVVIALRTSPWCLEHIFLRTPTKFIVHVNENMIVDGSNTKNEGKNASLFPFPLPFPSN